jgi:hypothetical protein
MMMACQDKNDSSPDGLTWFQDIQPIVGENCQACHNSTTPLGGAYPFDTHEEVMTWSAPMLAKMALEGDDEPPYYMPPVNARETDECEPVLPLQGAYHASADEVALFEEWMDAGMPEGDLDDATPYDIPETGSLSGENLTELGFSSPYLVPTDEGPDIFQCMAMQTADGSTTMTEDTWVTGLQFEPGYTPVVHHVLAYVVEDLDTHLASGLVEDEDTLSWACPGSPSQADGGYRLTAYDLVYGWVPGTLPLEFHEDTAIRIPEGAGLVLNFHYNLLALDADDVPLDDSTITLQTGTEPANEAVMHLFGVASTGASDEVDEPPYLVPPDTAGHIESYTKDYAGIPESMDIRIWGYTPHMHLAGTDIKLTHTKASGREDCIGHVPKWDYNWQQMYTFDGTFEDLPRVETGDSLQLRCTMDNTDENPFLAEYLGGSVDGENGEGIILGERTEDEMCIVALGVVCEGECPEL